MFGLGPMELMIVGVIAVLLFGNKLPEVGRSLGRSLVEFKKGMGSIQDEIETASSGKGGSSSRSNSGKYNDIDDRDEATAPKFDPPASEPKSDNKDATA